MSYAAPSPAALKARYPAFASVADETIAYWIEDSARGVDETWIEGDYQPARLALAAHKLALSGAGGGSFADIPAGVTSFRSGAFSVSFSDTAADIAARGGYGSTRYGNEYLALLARNKGGARVINSGAGLTLSRFNGLAGPIPTWQP